MFHQQSVILNSLVQFYADLNQWVNKEIWRMGTWLLGMVIP